MKAIALWSAVLIAAAGSAAAEGLWRPEPQIDCTGHGGFGTGGRFDPGKVIYR